MTSVTQFFLATRSKKNLITRNGLGISQIIITARCPIDCVGILTIIFPVIIVVFGVAANDADFSYFPFALRLTRMLWCKQDLQGLRSYR